jgi:hypothetical protein
MYTIEDNVPLPSRMGRPPKYPTQNLEVGQSFMVPVGDKKSLWNSVTFVRRKTQRRFCVRVVDGGVRVWRVE